MAGVAAEPSTSDSPSVPLRMSVIVVPFCLVVRLINAPID
jgi:hypothetical protein